jgi:tetratricopeptide (TPR) repeat protein
MSASRRANMIASAIFVLALLGIVGTLHAIDHLRRGATYQDVLYIRSPKALKRVSLGYTGLLADLYWTRAVQYFGYQHHQHSSDFHLLAPMLEIATQLDPKLLPAYQFGSNFLAPRPPNGAGEPEEAIALAKYGIQNNPDSWKLYYGLGFIYYTEMKDYSKAAEAFSRGAQIPGAHPFLRILGARMAQHAGEFETARMLWTTTYQTSQDETIQLNAVDHLRALRVDEDVTQLEKLADIYRARVGRTPGSMSDLVRAGLIGSSPVDPTGQPYKITSDGRVEVRNPDSILYITKGTPPNYQPPQPQADQRK